MYVKTLRLVLIVGCFIVLNQAISPGGVRQTDEPFEQVEAGVRLLGNSIPTAVLGRVLNFKSIPDTYRVMVVSELGLGLWDTEKKRILKSFDFDNKYSSCRAIAFSDNQRQFAICLSPDQFSNQQESVIWIVDQQLNEKKKIVIGSSSNPVTSLAFSQDDRRILVATPRIIYDCDADSGEVLEQYDLGSPRYSSNLMIKRGMLVGLGVDSFQFEIKNRQLTAPPKPLKAKERVVFSCIDRSRNRVYATTLNNEVLVLDFADGSSQKIPSEKGEQAFEVNLSPDHSTLATVKYQRDEKKFQIDLFDTETLVRKHRVINVPMRPTRIGFSDGNKTLQIAFPFDIGLHSLDLETDRETQKAEFVFNRNVETVILSGDGTKLVGKLFNTRGVEWDWRTGESKQIGGHNYFLNSSFSDGFLSVGQNGNDLLLNRTQWGAESKRIATFSMRKPMLLPAISYFSGFRDSPTTDQVYFAFPSSAAYDPMNSQLHCVVDDTHDGIRVQTFRLPSKERTRNIVFKRFRSEDVNSISTTAITSDGEHFAIVRAGQLELVEVETRKTLFTQECKEVRGMVFSNTKPWLAIQTNQGVKILDAETGKTLQEFTERDALFSYAHHGKRILIGSPRKGGRVQIVDTETWEVVLEHRTKTSKRNSAAISGDGRRVAFALDNGRLELWDLDQLME